jgi:hypothetical protein
MQTVGVKKSVNSWRLPMLLLAGTFTCAFLLYFGSLYLPMSIDWRSFFRPAALKFLQGQSPYEQAGFLNPPWVLCLLAPFALMPEPLGRAFLFVIAIAVILYAGYRMGGRLWALIALLLSPPVIALLFYGNIDWIVVLGLVLSPQIGMLLVAVKPQVGIFVLPVWILQAWQQGGWRQVIKISSPLVIVTLISFALYGFWPSHMLDTQGYENVKYMNFSLWPYSIPVGLILLFFGLRRKQMEFALAATPCLSPYVLMHSWIGAFLAIIRNQTLFILAVALVWVLLLT